MKLSLQNMKLTKNDFIQYVSEQTKGEDILILAGHFILIYDDDKNELKPAIWKEHKNSDLRVISQYIAGDFPVQSFDTAVDIQLTKKLNKEKCSFVLLANDHQVQSKSLSSFIKNNIKPNFGLLRKKYFQQNNIPRTFKHIADSRNTYIEYCKNTLKGSSLFNPYIFSETSLRKKFDRKIKGELSKSNSFNLKTYADRKSELYFKTQSGNIQCLTENGSCGCSGEVIQLIIELYESYNKTLVMLVPEECYQSVNLGVEAAITAIEYSNKKTKQFIIASGFGDNNYLGQVNKSIDITHFQLS